LGTVCSHAVLPVGAFEFAARSLYGIGKCESPLKHLGSSETPKKSTLAYANANRPWELYQTVFPQLLGKCRAEVASRGGSRKFRFKNKLMSLEINAFVLVPVAASSDEG
jgi:hypothetical protein